MQGQGMQKLRESPRVVHDSKGCPLRTPEPEQIVRIFERSNELKIQDYSPHKIDLFGHTSILPLSNVRMSNSKPTLFPNLDFGELLCGPRTKYSIERTSSDKKRRFEQLFTPDIRKGVGILQIFEQPKDQISSFDDIEPFLGKRLSSNFQSQPSKKQNKPRQNGQHSTGGVKKKSGTESFKTNTESNTCGIDCKCPDCLFTRSGPHPTDRRFMEGNQAKTHCTCKKSGCHKNYCICHMNGNLCGPSCSCQDCKNKEKQLKNHMILPTTFEEEDPLVCNSDLSEKSSKPIRIALPTQISKPMIVRIKL